MCGIAGIYRFDDKKVNKMDIQKMMTSIKHRGPDGQGMYIKKNVGLGHVLLKIQDITDSSSQPYQYKNYIVTYNGEIYNYVELRKELISKGYVFDTDGDTEVLIKMIDMYGLEETLSRIEGCFAFALLDKESDNLFLVRDRFGIKPFYFYNDDEKIVFCSEIKGILQNSDIPRKFNLDKVIESFNCKLWLSRETTLFQDIYCLKPGTIMAISNDGVKRKVYYSLEFTDQYCDVDELIRDFGKEFTSSVEKKLLSKVPVAAFLSGGLDSSIVCKLLNDMMDTSLDTYTICYDFDNDLDLNHSNLIAKKENFKNHNILITENMYSIENIDKVTYGVEEILIDKVYIPMYFNYKAAKDDGFTVVVSGQGSDEVWLGYIFTWPIFQYINEKYNKNCLLSDYYVDNMVFKNKLKNQYAKKIDGVLSDYLSNNWMIDKTDEMNSYGDLSLKTILHDLLIQEDKIAMMNSIESRVPFVDNHKIVELAYKASSRMKTFDEREKYIVREFAKGKIDDAIINREKYPFPEPPKIYNNVITKICEKNWNEIIKSKLISKMIKASMLKDIKNFTDIEQWWLLTYWRFEKVFKMEV